MKTSTSTARGGDRAAGGWRRSALVWPASDTALDKREFAATNLQDRLEGFTTIRSPWRGRPADRVCGRPGTHCGGAAWHPVSVGALAPDSSLQTAFDEKVLDLWPKITITPERLKQYYISELLDRNGILPPRARRWTARKDTGSGKLCCQFLQQHRGRVAAEPAFAECSPDHEGHRVRSHGGHVHRARRCSVHDGARRHRGAAG